jgi:MFS family permease
MDFSLIAAVGVGLAVGAFIFGRSSKEKDNLRPQKPITQNVLDYAATLGLLLGMVFWITFFFSAFRPDLMEYPWSIPWWIIAALLGISITVVLPLLFSLTLPNDPINMMLQDSKKHTWGFMVQVASVIFVSVIAFRILDSWMNVQGTTVGESGYGRSIAIIIVIITVVVPNLAWQQAIPLNWQWQLQQSLEIQKMRRRHAAELMMMSAEHVKQIANLMVDTNQATVDNIPQIAEQYAKFMRSMYGRMNGEMKGIGYLIAAVSGAKDVRVPGANDEDIRNRFSELQDMMARGLELGVEERDVRQFQLTDDRR